MVAKTNAIFLAKRTYTKKDRETGEKITMRCYDFLAYEEEESNGLSSPEIKTMVVLDTDRHMTAESLKVYEKCVLTFDVVTGREIKFISSPLTLKEKQSR